MKKIAAIVRNHVPSNASKDVQDVINQSRFVGKVLREQGWSVVEVELGSDIGEVVSALRGIRPHVVFNLVESFMGSDELASMAPVIFRNLGYSFTGADSPVLFMTNDKLAAKRHLMSVDLPTPRGIDEIGLRRGRFSHKGRYIIKSRYEHASLGLDDTSVIQADKAEDLLAAMEDQRQKLGGSCIAEEFIDGREFSVSLIEYSGGKCMILGSAEIAFRPDMDVKIVGYQAKWDEGSDADKSTVRGFEFRKAEPDLSSLLEKTALDCWEEMGLRGYARVDFRVDSKGKAYIIDVNANPCLSEDAGFIATATEAGWKPDEVISSIVKSALGRYAN